MKKLLTLSLLVLATVSLNLNGQELSFDDEQMIITPIKNNKDKEEARIYTNQAEKNFIEGLERGHNLYKATMTPQQIAAQITRSAIDSRKAEERYNELNKLMNPRIGHGVQKSKTAPSNNASCNNCNRKFSRSDLSLHKANCFPLHCEINSSCHHLQFYSKWTLKDHLNKIHGLSNELIKAVYKLN